MWQKQGNCKTEMAVVQLRKMWGRGLQLTIRNRVALFFFHAPPSLVFLEYLFGMSSVLTTWKT